MARSRATTVLALLAGASLIGLGVYLNRGGADRRGTAKDSAPGEIDAVIGKRKPADRDAPFAKLTVSPEKVELGAVSSCGPRRTFEVALANDGDRPVRVEAWVATCACIAPLAAPGFTIEPKSVYTLPIAVEPWNFGAQSHRIDFRASGEGLSSNATAARLRVDFRVEGALRARPAVVTRPDGKRNFAVNIDHVSDGGEFVPSAYEVLGVEPRVAQILPPLENGHGAINIDFQAIDELAKSPDAAGNPAFEWSDTPEGRRWKSIDLTVRTNLDSCPEVHVRVRNRAR